MNAGVRMMFLSLEQLQKLKLNPTRADYEIAYETEVKEQEGTAIECIRNYGGSV